MTSISMRINKFTKKTIITMHSHLYEQCTYMYVYTVFILFSIKMNTFINMSYCKISRVFFSSNHIHIILHNCLEILIVVVFIFILAIIFVVIIDKVLVIILISITISATYPWIQQSTMLLNWTIFISIETNMTYTHAYIQTHTHTYIHTYI